MDNQVDSPDQNSNECDEVLILKKKLSDTENKLVKFKQFVLNLKNERTQLEVKNEEKCLEIEKLKSEISKFQNKKQIFQNFQVLQCEYDKLQDSIENLKKLNKDLEIDLLKCSEELNKCRELNETIKDENSSLKNNLANQQTQINEILETKKELKSKINILETEYKNEIKKNVDFKLCEDEIKQLIDKLNSKNTLIEDLSSQLNNALSNIDDFQNDVNKKNDLIQKYINFEKENNELQEILEQKNNIINCDKQEIETLKSENEVLKSEIKLLKKSNDDLSSTNAQCVSTMQLQIDDLQNKLYLSEEDLKLHITKFEEYKLKVSNVLKENNLNSFNHVKNLEDLTLQIETLKEENDSLRKKYDTLSCQSENFQKKNENLQSKLDSLNGLLNDKELLKQKINSLTEDNEKLNNSIKQLQSTFSHEKKQLLDSNLANIDALKDKYENRIKDLEQELLNLQNTFEDTHSLENSNTSFEEIKEENLSVKSVSQSTNSSFEKNFLEEILNSETSHKANIPDIQTNEPEINNLTQLLSESENNICLLSEQNRLLKDEIRRLHRSIERVEIADNLEYLKNVLLKFITIKRLDEKEHLITVLTTILKLTPEERQLFHECISGNQKNDPNAKWNLWQWT